jgi:sulfur transfer complex TusBCD TusB component (DsrH family)
VRFSANQVSATTIATIKTVLDALNVTAASTDAQKITLIRNAIYLLMASSEYLVQK